MHEIILAKVEINNFINLIEKSENIPKILIVNKFSQYVSFDSDNTKLSTQ